MVTLPLELLLKRLSPVKIKRVVDGHRHLPCNLLEKPKVCGLIRFLSNAAQGHSPQASVRRAQWQTAAGFDVIFAQPLHRAWEANFVLNVGNIKSLLSLPYKTRERFVDGQFRNQLSGRGFFQNVYTHYVALWIMQPHTQVVEVKHIAQRLGEIVEQLG